MHYCFLCPVQIEIAMNLLDILQEYTVQIMDDPLLVGDQMEEKIIQVFDLCHFIDGYTQPLKVIDYKHKINIIEDGGVQKGIYFCDLFCSTQYFFEKSFYAPGKLSDLRRQLNIKELWYVIVEEGFKTGSLTASKAFIKRNNIDSVCEKIFYFNFSQSIIKILK